MELSRDVLKHVSIDYAEPILYCRSGSTIKTTPLSVLSCQPGDPRIFKEIQLMVHVREVSPILGTAVYHKSRNCIFLIA
jgi:hypothetical protein